MRIVRLQSRPLLTALTTLVFVLLLAISPAAQANIGETIILRCTNGKSLSGFSQRAYNEALKELNADTEEYSGCSSLIREAERAAAAGGRGSSGGGQSTAGPVAVTATPSERQAITHALHRGPHAVKLAGGAINPGVVRVNVASALSSLPTPLLATLAFLLACLLLVAGGALRNRVRARRSD
jgi:hypothetical protein